MNESNGFREWCIIELMGHSTIAGIVSEQAIGGESFIRVDVPEVEKMPGYTKMFGKGAIYSITPTDEATCRIYIVNAYQPPVSRYMLRAPDAPELHDDDEGIPI